MCSVTWRWTPVIRDTVISGIRLPNDLPAGGGADQVAVLMLGMTKHIRRTRDTSESGRSARVCQKADRDADEDGAILELVQPLARVGKSAGLRPDRNPSLPLASADLAASPYVAAGVLEVENFLRD